MGAAGWIVDRHAVVAAAVLAKQMVEGETNPGCALHQHCLTMVERGYLERIKVGGSRTRMQGAQPWATFRARAVALALLDLLEKGEALQAELAAIRPPRPRAVRS